MAASMDHGISLYPAPDLKNLHGSLWAGGRSSILVGFFAPGGLSGPISHPTSSPFSRLYLDNPQLEANNK